MISIQTFWEEKEERDEDGDRDNNSNKSGYKHHYPCFMAFCEPMCRLTWLFTLWENHH